MVWCSLELVSQPLLLFFIGDASMRLGMVGACLAMHLLALDTKGHSQVEVGGKHASLMYM